MYYRRKILLSILQVFDNKLEKIRLQKLLLLYTKKQSIPAYQFVPYKYGCFSFQANADLSTLAKYGQVTDDGKHWNKSDTTNYIQELKDPDRKLVKNIKRLYGDKSNNELIRATYIKFPYLAINSFIAPEILTKKEYQAVVEKKPLNKNNVLYTIGYEGISLEGYLNKLIINDIKVLCDVRKNSLSMKYGFSKSQLRNACEDVGIMYSHFPDLGIESNKRQKLNSQSDYDKLFKQYCEQVLEKATLRQKQILDLLKSRKRVALTCFEANVNQCHRKHLAESITRLQGFKYQLKHI